MSYKSVTGIPDGMTIEKNCMCTYHKCKTYCLSCVIVQCKLNVPCMDGAPAVFLKIRGLIIREKILTQILID